MDLKKKLSQLRKAQGLTQLELSEALGVSRQAVSRWEVGTAVPSLENLVALSGLYNVTLDYLIHDELEMPESEKLAPTNSGAVKQKVSVFQYLVPAFLFLAFAAGALTLRPNTRVTERNKIMDIVNSVSMSLYRPIRSAAAQTTKSEADSFAEQSKSYYGVSGTGNSSVILSPALQLRIDYNKWKEAQPPRGDLPNSQGPTEENMAYLRERYSGDLTMFRKMEALDTMFDMGIITREQRSFFYGTKEITWAAGQAKLREGPLVEDFMNQEAQLEQELYRLSPLAKSVTLDDLFSWLE